jgi:hypothetical protein
MTPGTIYTISSANTEITAAAVTGKGWKGELSSQEMCVVSAGTFPGGLLGGKSFTISLLELILLLDNPEA